MAVAAAVAVAPVIDGRLDDDAWTAAPALTDFVQREPFEGRPASERTEVRIVYDREALYIGAWLLDRDAAGIVVGEARRDVEPTDSDALLIILDTYLDRQNGFVFGTTPAGIEYDGQVTREGQGGGGAMRQQTGSGGGFNKNWDGSWEVATSRDDAGWYAELRIPFSTLRYGGAGAQTWGLNIARRIRRNNEESLWASIPRQFDLYRLSSAGTLTGLEAPVRRPASITPYVLGSRQRDFRAGGGAEYAADFGADAKLRVAPSLTLDLTYNTDFAQVEVDDEQINLTRFRLFFPEKRPFFLENAGTFAVGTGQAVDLFFSRRIGIHGDRPVPIVGGGRLTGRVGGATIGVLGIRTSGLDAPDAGTGEVVAFAPANTFGVARVMRELPNRSRLGGIFVARFGDGDGEDRNLTYGIDGRLGIGEALSFDGYAARTETPGLEGPEHAYNVSGSYTTRDWRIGASYREVGEDFNPEVGFLARSGYRYTSLRVLRALRFEQLDWFRELRPHVTYWHYADPGGFTETRLLHIDSHFELANGAFFQLPAINFTWDGLREPFTIYQDDTREVIVPPGTYENVEWGFRYNTDLSAPLSIEGTIDIGGFYSGRRAGGTTTLNGRLGGTFTAGLRYSYNDVRLPEGDFTTTLVGLRAAYAFTPRVYLQSLIQYNDRTGLFSSNVRFGWLATAGTGLFIVYNDIASDGVPTTRGGITRPVERSLVVKFTRQFDLVR